MRDEKKSPLSPCTDSRIGEWNYRRLSGGLDYRAVASCFRVGDSAGFSRLLLPPRVYAVPFRRAVPVTPGRERTKRKRQASDSLSSYVILPRGARVFTFLLAAAGRPRINRAAAGERTTAAAASSSFRAGILVDRALQIPAKGNRRVPSMP